MAEEVHIGYSDDLGRGTLLSLANPTSLFGGMLSIPTPPLVAMQ
ncbi:hypothetical protein JOF55_003871 [Haloactinomyces albus]|uniref:Uncharacterized protein n=1 Tax=Haloactinomyces albus TaxID=1352928 RepID=A0AAE3ZGL6_9ACTN|nr:hypothetical protein [Haloactinomyces albus]